MEPFAQAYENQTVVHPVGLTALVLLTLALWILPRRFAFLPLLLLAALIPSAQRIVVAGMDFTFLRLLVIAGLARVLARAEWRGMRVTPLDRVLVVWTLVSAIVSVARLRSSQVLIFELGLTLDIVGMYVLTRFLVRTWRDVDRLALGAIVVAIPTAIIFLNEAQTGRNLFAAFGGVPALTDMREGKLRCSGAFGNSILAGCFWASLMPLMAARAFQQGASRALAAVGVVCAMVVVVACHSSTPIMGILFGSIGVAFYPWRFSLRWVRRGIVLTLVTLHLVMKAPVWHLISRVDLVGGSTGYHRYNLIDKFIRNFGEWWLLGTNSTGHWAWGLGDVANMFVAQGVRGGLATFVLFIAVITLAFKQNGQTLRRERDDRGHSAYAFALGISVLMHAAMFFGVAYFGQIQVIFYGTLGVIASLSALPVPALARAEAAARPAPEAPDAPRGGAAPEAPEKPWTAPSLADGLLRRRSP